MSYKIPATNFPRLEEEITKMQKRAAKLGVPPVKLMVVGETKEKVKDNLGFTYDRVFKLVEIEGERPMLNGWSLVAVKTPQPNGENLVKCVPGLEVPPIYRTKNCGCEHCGKTRVRKDVFILHSAQGHKQVGRNCLSDFLGGVSPEQLIANAEMELDLDSMVREAESDGWGSVGPTVVEMSRFLATTAIVIRRLGWVSGKKASEEMTTSTATWAWRFCVSSDIATQNMIKELNIHAESRDVDVAEQALTWARALPTDGDSYLFNLGVACRQEYVKYDNSGIVASAVSAYQRYCESQASVKNCKHVGEIGVRTAFPGLKVVALRSFPGRFGMKTMCKFADPAGNFIIWWATGEADWLVEGETVDITATVKSHDCYKDVPQTAVTRVKPGIGKGLPNHEPVVKKPKKGKKK